jgi:hypothetical protein
MYKNGVRKTLYEVQAEMERQKSSKLDITVDSRQLTMGLDAGTRAVFMNVPTIDPITNQWDGNFSQYGLTDFCHSQIATKCGIPQAYYEKMLKERPELLPVNVNSWLPDKEKRLVRILDGRVRAVLSDRYRIMDNQEVVDILLLNLNKIQQEDGLKIEVEDCYLTEEHLYIKITSPDLSGQVFHFKDKPAEPVRGGIIISNSEVGSGAFAVKPFVNVLVCSNGLIGENAINKIHLGRERALGTVWSERTLEAQDNVLILELEDLIKQTFNRTVFQQWLDRINKVASTEIEKPTVAVENIIKKYILPKGARDDLINQFSKEGNSVWGLSMAVTRKAQDLESIEERVRWERIGAKILEDELTAQA